jgi:phage/plasmid-associated DNA primase
MYLGLGLFNRGKMTDKVENCLMLFGAGSNGKSVVYETVKGIFGSPNISEMGLMALIRGGDERYRNMNKIDGKVFNYCAEVQARDISTYSDAFKSLCSGENQYARVIGKDIYMVKNVPWLIFNMNNPPRSTDASYGFFRRFLYVVFDHVIPDEKQNKHLARDLAGEYPGILNWIMRGRGYLKRRHYLFPISENAERRKLLNIGESNPTLMWIKLRGVRNSSYVEGELYAWLKSTDLYNDMVSVCEKNGFTPDSHRKFSLELRKYGWGSATSKKRSSEGIVYRVYGMNESAFKEIPDIADMDLTTEDTLEREASYEPGDIN